jgi:hypothetical protein
VSHGGDGFRGTELAAQMSVLGAEASLASYRVTRSLSSTEFVHNGAVSHSRASVSSSKFSGKQTKGSRMATRGMSCGW